MRRISPVLLTFLVAQTATMGCALDEATPDPVTTTGETGNGGTEATDGGSGPGMGGTPTGGTAPTTGGNGPGMGGAGGAAPMGGAGGEMATGGTGGMAAGGTGGMLGPAGPKDIVGVDVNDFGFAWKDSWYLTPCYSLEGMDCTVWETSCGSSGNVRPNQMHESYTDHEREGRVFIEKFDIGGEEGKNYDVTIKVVGVVEAKFYQNGMRDDGPADANFNPANNNNEGTDTFHRNGDPRGSHHSIYKMSIFNPGGDKHSHYHMNSLAPQAEIGLTFVINYTKTITVPGGGTVEYLNADRNCKVVNNCGPGSNQADECDNSRRLPGDEANTEIPRMYGGLSIADISRTQEQPYMSQLIHVTITDVVEAQ